MRYPGGMLAEKDFGCETSGEGGMLAGQNGGCEYPSGMSENFRPGRMSTRKIPDVICPGGMTAGKNSGCETSG